MTFFPAPLQPTRAAFLTRVTPATRVLVGFVWLIAVIVTLDPIVPVRLIVVAIVALALWSGLPLRLIPGRLLPIWISIASLTAFAILLNAANSDPALPVAVEIGPIRIVWEAVWAGVAIGLRVVLIALTSLLVFGPSDPTALADSTVQQWHLPDRFAYGALAALRVAPFIAADWQTIRAARRLRGVGAGGLRGFVTEAGPQLLNLLVSGIRRAERIALAMDARGFDSGLTRSHYRQLQVGWRDWVTIAAGAAVAAAAVLVGR